MDAKTSSKSPVERPQAADPSRDDQGLRWPVVALLGATASGKSSIAMQVALRTGAVIVNCDALQIYRGLDVGTAKPNAEDRRRVEHLLFDLKDPTERFSAGEYARLAAETLDRVTLRGPAIVVGGTGLYYRALTRGIAAIPPISEDLRNEIRDTARSEGKEATYQRLLSLDPDMAAQLNASDRQRVLRALEVILGTKKSQARWIAEQRPPNHSWSLTPFLLTLERSLLYDRIRVRTQAMFESQWTEEVQWLLEQGVPTSAPAFQAIGYCQMIEVVQGRLNETEALKQILVATRRYAKRQETWFRKEPNLKILAADQQDMAVDQLVGVLSLHSHPSSRGSL